MDVNEIENLGKLIVEKRGPQFEDLSRELIRTVSNFEEKSDELIRVLNNYSGDRYWETLANFIRLATEVIRRSVRTFAYGKEIGFEDMAQIIVTLSGGVSDLSGARVFAIMEGKMDLESVIGEYTKSLRDVTHVLVKIGNRIDEICTWKCELP